MFRIRRVFEAALPVDQRAVAQVQKLLRAQIDQFPGLREREIAKLPELLRGAPGARFRTILFVAETRQEVRGFAVLSHAPQPGFCYLDFLGTGASVPGRGIGDALYDRAREQALELGCAVLLCDCPSDDPALCPDPAVLKQNVARLRFFERYGARPVAGTAYEAAARAPNGVACHLVLDPLGRSPLPSRDLARAMVGALLERRHVRSLPREQIEQVVSSFVDDPVQLRSARYVKAEPPVTASTPIPEDARIALVVNDQHEIHHVRERGYGEAPARIATILRELDRTDLFTRLPVQHFSERHIKSLHDSGFFEYLKRMCQSLPADESVYPYVFPLRNTARRPDDLPIRAGYYCMDTFTPLTRNAFVAATRGVDCALTAAATLLDGRRLAYALIRPPGHHAERRAFGGFCYFNNAAIAAHFLSQHGRVALLDLDYHHGNGQQDIFYERDDVLTLSIHGHPRFAYPYFTGFEDETGAGPGKGFNVNLPLPEISEPAQHREAVASCLKRVARFKPSFLVVALGLDTAKNDPTGTWALRASDFEANGLAVGALRLPTLVTQEGGYDNRVLGRNARSFFSGLWAGAQGRPPLPGGAAVRPAAPPPPRRPLEPQAGSGAEQQPPDKPGEGGPANESA